MSVNAAGLECTMPVLVNAAGNATRHRYVRSARSTLGTVKEHQVTGVVHIFECLTTGAERVWGFDSTSEFAAAQGGKS